MAAHRSQGETRLGYLVLRAVRHLQASFPWSVGRLQAEAGRAHSDGEDGAKHQHPSKRFVDLGIDASHGRGRYVKTYFSGVLHLREYAYTWYLTQKLL